MVATLPGTEAALPESVRRGQCLERTVFSCDYNGWADVPEDEREAIEAFELSSEARAELPSKRLIPVPAQPPKNLPHRKAA